MTGFAFGLRRALPWLTVVAVLTLSACAVVMAQPQLELPDANLLSHLGHWLHLPCALVTAVSLAIGAHIWPTLARDRPGSAWLQRMRDDPRHRVLACSGVLLANFLVLIAAGAGFGLLWSWRQPELQVRTHLRAVMASEVLLPGKPLRARVLGQEPVDRIRLQPIAVFAEGAGTATPAVLVRADGQTLTAAPLDLPGTEPIWLDLPARTIQELEIETVRPGTPLVFGPQSIMLASSTPQSLVLNAALAALSYGSVTALVLAGICMSRGLLESVLLHVSVQFVAMLLLLANLTPGIAAITALCRGRWLLGEGLTLPWLSCLLIAVILFTLAAKPFGRRSP